MVSLFGGKAKDGSAAAAGKRVLRHSTGWGQLLVRMRLQESLRILDIGATSSGNINLITSLGHSIYLANLVEDAAKSEWTLPDEDGGPGRFDVERYLASHLDFAGRGFDVVLFWDVADYLPEGLLEPVLDRLSQVMTPGGQMLALFHSSSGSANTEFSRYHLTDSPNLEIQIVGEYPLLTTYTNRQIENLMASYRSFHFFLGKDNLREVLVTK
jgi:hypothetical protein